MIVADASAILELLLARPAGAPLAQRLRDGEEVGVPHLLDVEVAQVLRRYVHRDQLGPATAGELLDDFLDLPFVRYPHTPLLRRAFELRENATAYDAVYLALAEALDTPLWTADTRLASVPGCAVEVKLTAEHS